MIKRYIYLSILLVTISVGTVSCDKEAPTGTFTVDKTEAMVGEVLNITLTAEDNRKIDVYGFDVIISNAAGLALDTVDIVIEGSTKSVNETYQYTIPAVTAAGDSITTGFVFNFIGDVWDKRSQNYHFEEAVTIL